MKPQINPDAGVVHGEEPGRHVNGRAKHENEALKRRNAAHTCGNRRGICVNGSSKSEDGGGNCGREDLSNTRSPVLPPDSGFFALGSASVW